MTDDGLRRGYARHLADGLRDRRERCVAPEALLALVERRGSEEERLATLDHVGACAACRGDLDLLRAVHQAGQPTGPRVLTSRRWLAAPSRRLAAAAVLVIAVGAVATVLRRTDEGLTRGGAAELSLIAPAESVVAGSPVTLTWHALPGADRYQVELLGMDGDSLFAQVTTDTTVTLPAASLPAVAQELLWSVRASLRDGTHSSASRRLRVRRP